MVRTLALRTNVPNMRRRLASAAAVTMRNTAVARQPTYWGLFGSGLFEPLLYLLSVGVGVGALFGGFLPTDTDTTYAAFVAPAMLAALSMQGAMAEAFNFFVKMNYMRLYDATLATPIVPVEITFGELLWAMVRSTVYSITYLVILVLMDLTTPLRALVLLLASIAVGFAFGALGMMLATFVRDTADLDHVLGVQSVLFLFSGTFVPVDSYPRIVRVIVELTPLYHAVELLRALAGAAGVDTVPWHLGYLLVLTIVGLTLAVRRMAANLYP